MILKIDAKFVEKLTCSLKNNVRNLLNFHQTTQKSENLNPLWVTFIESICLN